MGVVELVVVRVCREAESVLGVTESVSSEEVSVMGVGAGAGAVARETGSIGMSR
jgi:hypothetical protein